MASGGSSKNRNSDDHVPSDMFLRVGTLRSKLECPICMELPVPPIMLCQTGHSICGKCRKRTIRCPTCRSPFNGARNYALEEVAALLQVNCKNSGCSEILSVDSIEDHLATCEYRPIPCSSGNCGKTLIDYTEFLNHLVRVHNRTIRFTSSWYDLYCRDWDAKIFEEQVKASCVPQPLIQAGLTLMINIAVEYSTMFIWVAGLMSQDEASKYLATLRLDDNAQYSSKTIEWTMGVTPIHKDDFETVKNTPDCASIPLRTLRGYSEMSECNTRYTFSMQLLVSEKNEPKPRDDRSPRRRRRRDNARFENSPFETIMEFLGF